MRKNHRRVKNRTNVHHIFPKSKMPQLRNAEWNKVVIDQRLHELYHQLFENRTPQEIIEYLNEYFWGGQILDIGTNDGTCQ
jgi:broad specificity phosphatase PhoE